jgi:pSer/pThr/pTyr-binding forkhead associated (FHA) protein
VLGLDLPGTSGGAEYSKDLIQDDSSSRLGKRYTRIYRATSTIADVRPYRFRVSR